MTEFDPEFSFFNERCFTVLYNSFGANFKCNQQRLFKIDYKTMAKLVKAEIEVENQFYANSSIPFFLPDVKEALEVEQYSRDN